MRLLIPFGFCLTSIALASSVRAIPIDRDCDGLSDEEELALGTDPDNPDTDGDGLLDGLEMGVAQTSDPRCGGARLDRDPETTTSPTNRDTDGDGLFDGEEDPNHNGRRDRGETNGRFADSDGDGTSDRVEQAARTNPNRNALNSFPEPMVYDLVRGLDADRGELEANVLVLARPLKGARLALQYAPEIEWAFADGHAVELELPCVEDRLEAVKLALQGRLGEARDTVQHGWQVLAEVALDRSDAQLALTHIGNFLLGERLRVVSIVGGLFELHEPLESRRAMTTGLLANASMYYAVAPMLSLGFEGNALASLDGDGAGRVAWLAMPQAHVQLNHHVRIQAGLGVTGGGGPLAPQAGVRAIIEL
jgi:hypothetical protein